MSSSIVSMFKTEAEKLGKKVVGDLGKEAKEKAVKTAQDMKDSVKQQTMQIMKQKMDQLDNKVKPAAPTTTSSKPAAPTTTSSKPAAPTTTSSKPAAPTTTSSKPAAPTTTSSKPAAPTTSNEITTDKVVKKLKPYFSGRSLLVIGLFALGFILLVVPIVLNYTMKNSSSSDLINTLLSCGGALVMAISSTVVIFDKKIKILMRMGIIASSTVLVTGLMLFSAYFNTKVHFKSILISVSLAFITYVYILLLSNKSFGKKELTLYTAAFLAVVIAVISVVLFIPEMTGKDKKLRTTLVIVISCVSGILFIGICIKIFLKVISKTKFLAESGAEAVEADPELLALAA